MIYYQSRYNQNILKNVFGSLQNYRITNIFIKIFTQNIVVGHDMTYLKSM